MSELATMRGRKQGKTPNNGLPFPAEIYNSVKVPESLDWRLYGKCVQLKLCPKEASSWNDPLVLAQLCSCRRCDPSEGPGHLWLLLELCHHWSNRGRSLPKGEMIKSSLHHSHWPHSSVFQPTGLLPHALCSRECSSVPVLVDSY